MVLHVMNEPLVAGIATDLGGLSLSFQCRLCDITKGRIPELLMLKAYFPKVVRERRKG